MRFPWILLALLIAAAWQLVWPPQAWSLLDWVAWVPLMVASMRLSPKRAALLGLAYGTLAHAAFFSWLAQTVVTFGGLPLAVGVAVLLVFSLVHAWPFALVFGLGPRLRARSGAGWLLLLPALWVVTEQAPALFPWQIGAAHIRDLPTIQLASLFGASGISFLVLLVNGLLAELILRRAEGRPPPLVPLVLGACLLLVTQGWGAFRQMDLARQQAAGPQLRVAQLQVDLDIAAQSRLDGPKRLKTWMDLLVEARADRPDLVIFPEGALRTEVESDKPSKLFGGHSPLDFFGKIAREGKLHLLAGGLHIGQEAGQPVRTSAAWSISRQGALLARTDKRELMPIGEIRPFAGSIPAIAALFGSGRDDLRPGIRPIAVSDQTAAGVPYRYTVPICYEAILSGTMRWLYRGEDGPPADLFVVISNDAWFGDTASPYQHAGLTAVQAVAFGRPMVRQATTGVSWVVAANGEIRHATEPFTRVARVVELPLFHTDTVYAAGGWTFPGFCALGLLLTAIGARARRRTGSSSQA